MTTNDQFDQGLFRGEVLAKLDAIHGSIDVLAKKVEGQEERVRILENWRWGIGAAIVVSGVGGAAQLAKAMNFL